MTEGHASVDNMPDLARVGAAKVKAKVCTETGKFSTITVPSNYKEPQSKNTGIRGRGCITETSTKFPSDLKKSFVQCFTA